MSDELMDSQKQISEAEARAKIAEARMREEAAKQAIRDQKAESHKKKISAFGKLSKKIKTIIILVVVFVVIAAIAIIPGLLTLGQKGVTVSEASLKKAVEISKLSTAEFSYNGIAEKLNDNGDVVYHIYYEGTADAGIDMAETQFVIDQSQKIITIIIPDITVNNPIIDESAMEFLPSNAHVDLREVLEICKADMQEEIAHSANIKEIAASNLRSTIEALLLPIIGDEGYTITWENAASSSQNADNQNDVDSQDGVNNEDAQ